MNKTEDIERVADFRSSVPFPSQARLAAGRARLLSATPAAAVTRWHAAAGRQFAGRQFTGRQGAVRRFTRSRTTIAAATAIAAVAAGTGYALTAHPAAPARPARPAAAGQATRKGHPAQVTQQAALAAKLLNDAADRIARAATIPEPAPGQWIYYLSVSEGPGSTVPVPSDPEWVTFDGGQTAYYEGATGPLVVHTNMTSFPPRGTSPWTALNDYGVSPETAWDALAALPPGPRALLAVIARQVATPDGKQFAMASVTNFLGGRRQETTAQLEFDYLVRLLWNARNGLGGPAAAEAAVYRAVATLPGISVQQGITDAAGAPAIGVSANGGYNQLLLSPATYQVIGWRVISDGRPAVDRRLRVAWPAKGALIVSTAFTLAIAVAAPGDR